MIATFVTRTNTVLHGDWWFHPTNGTVLFKSRGTRTRMIGRLLRGQTIFKLDSGTVFVGRLIQG